MIRRALAIFLLTGAVQFSHAQDTTVTDTTAVMNSEDSIDSSSTEKTEEVADPLPVLRKVPDSAVRKMKQDDDFVYANDPAYWQHHKDEDDRAKDHSDFWDGVFNFFSNPAVKMLAYILAGLAFAFIIYRIIVVNNLYVFHSSRKIRQKGNETEEELNESNIDEKIRKSIQIGNYRDAVRYYYLKTLQILGDKGWIQLHSQATNYDYINQMNRHAGADKFNYLTRAFDYVWYGEFDLSEGQFTIVQNAFQNFHNNIRA